jgi:hypothetical protein
MLALVISRIGPRGAATDPQLTPTSSERLATPTALALDAPDEVIGGGDQARAAAYPITLQVTTPDRRAPRVWVVQRRLVRTAAWNYDPNPDTASFLSGMSVRPVIGIPYSPENADWFEAMGAGAEFVVQMNTGAIRRYQFAEIRALRRSDTDIFRQVAPGLALILIGETDAEGLPTAVRTLVTADYAPEQELSRLEALSVGQPTSLPTMTRIPSTEVPFAGMEVQVIAVTYGGGQITTRLRLYNGGSKPMPFTANDLCLTLGYTSIPSGPRLPAEGLAPLVLLPEQAADLTLAWVWSGEPFGVLNVGAYRYRLQFTPG